MSKFKIGKKVKCIRGLCKGVTGTISKIDEDVIWCKDWSDGKNGHLSEDKLELIQEKTRDFKIGKRVEIINSYFTNGVTGTISEIENKSETKIWCDEWSDGGGRDWMPPSQLKIIDEGEGEYESYTFPYMPMPEYGKVFSGLWDIDTPPAESKIKTMLRNIPRTLKRVLSPDLQKQYKAGLIDSDLELTEKGEYEMLDILSQQEVVKKGLTKYAEEIIAKSKIKK